MLEQVIQDSDGNLSSDPSLIWQSKMKKYIEDENDVLFSNDTGKLGKKFRVLLSGVEPKTFRLLVRMLYH